MVSQTKSPAGALFQSLGAIASICILVSKYPFHLSNVSQPIRATCSLIGTRATIIPVGMLMVTWIPVVPRAQRTTVDSLMVNIHTLGAVLFILGYVAVEWLTLRRLQNSLQPVEKIWRRVAVVSALVFTVGFEVAGALEHWDALEICCKDEWMDTTDAFHMKYGNMTGPVATAMLEVLKHKYGAQVLVDTASSQVL